MFRGAGDTSHPRPRQGLNARGTWRWTPPRGDRQNAKFHTATGSHLSYREGRFWQPDVTVATVVVDGGRLLCVEERANGSVVINQPAGHLEPDESLEQAALRETREETGWDVRLTAFIGAYQWKAPVRAGESDGRHYLRFAFAAEPVRHDPVRPLDDGIRSEAHTSELQSLMRTSYADLC